MKFGFPGHPEARGASRQQGSDEWPRIRSIEGAPPAEQTSERDTPAELKNVTVNLVCERASKEQQLECELAITTRAREPAATSWVASMPSSRGICTSIGITSPAWAAGRCRRRGSASCGRHRLDWPSPASCPCSRWQDRRARPAPPRPRWCACTRRRRRAHPHPAKDHGWAAYGCRPAAAAARLLRRRVMRHRRRNRTGPARPFSAFRRPIAVSALAAA
jgi:hypothetical protein